jgi:hypothetical protein
MANKKVSQLSSKPSVLVTDLFPIADPSTGQLYKTTISDLGTAIGSGVSSVNGLVGAVVLDTDDIQELVSPTNKWFTDTRARAALSASSPLAYNSGTGVFSIPAATSSQNGYLTSTDWTTFNNKLSTATAASTYVPYTGATANVNLGQNYSLTAALIIKSGGTSTQFLKADGTIDTNTYALDSAVVKLTGNQTIAGTKTFSDGSYHDYGLLLKHGTSTNASGYTGIAGTSTGIKIGVGTPYHSSLVFSTSATYTYTFPSVTGTIALTSDLASYLPLSGGTLTGALSGTSISLSSSVTASALYVTGMTAGSGAIYHTGSRLTFANYNANGIVDFEVNGGASALTLNADLSATFKAGGSFAGALSGTSANFAGTVTNRGLVIDGANNGNVAKINWTRTDQSWSVNNETNLRFYTSSGNTLSPATQVLELVSTGAATFSSSVTAVTSGANSGFNTGALIAKSNGNNFRYTQVGYDNTGNYGWIQALEQGTAYTNLILNGAGGNVGIGTTSPSATLHVVGSQLFDGQGATFKRTGVLSGQNWNLGIDNSGLSFYDNTNSAYRLVITSGGGVAIGATAAGGTYKLRVINSSAGQADPIFASDNNVYNSILVYGAGADGYNAAATVAIFGRNTSTSRSINAGGTINAMGLDYAEYMTKGIDDNISKGDIVGINSIGLLTNKFSESISFAIKSTNPSYVGGDTWANVDDIGKLPLEPTKEEKEAHYAKIEEARKNVDRVAFSGQVPCNVLGANVGDYIIPVNDNGKIKGIAVSNPTFEQYQISVGKVWKIMEDGRAWVAVKIG